MIKRLLIPFKSVVSILVLTNLLTGALNAQDQGLLKQLEESQYLKNVMKADTSAAGMTRWSKKTVEQ